MTGATQLIFLTMRRYIWVANFIWHTTLIAEWTLEKKKCEWVDINGKISPSINSSNCFNWKLYRQHTILIPFEDIISLVKEPKLLVWIRDHWFTNIITGQVNKPLIIHVQLWQLEIPEFHWLPTSFSCGSDANFCSFNLDVESVNSIFINYWPHSRLGSAGQTGTFSLTPLYLSSSLLSSPSSLYPINIK